MNNPFDCLNPAAVLCRGDVFFMKHEDVDGVHYFVLLNADTKEAEVLVFGVLTTQIDKRREYIRLVGFPRETLVEFDYERKSAIDCNNVKEMSKSTLIEKIKTGEARVCKSIPKYIIEMIITGVIAGNSSTRIKLIMQGLRKS